MDNIIKSQNSSKGRAGEAFAVNYIVRMGFKILEKNWRYSRFGEIDIIAQDDNTIVFIEVKSRTSCKFGHPFESVDEKKFEKIKKLAEIYLSKNNHLSGKNVRFDIIGILLKNNPEITYLKNIY